jgi:hypothetical protein
MTHADRPYRDNEPRPLQDDVLHDLEAKNVVRWSRCYLCAACRDFDWSESTVVSKGEQVDA